MPKYLSFVSVSVKLICLHCLDLDYCHYCGEEMIIQLLLSHIGIM